MEVFISWSGDTSKAIATLLRKYLPIMLQQLRPFMSRQDITTGSRWSVRIQEELEKTSFGIIVLTPSNLNARWLLFEAGAISKLKNSGAACLLCAGLDETSVVGPLQQFHFQRFEKEPFFKLLADMNQYTASPLADEALGLVFEKWWPDIEKDYDGAVTKYQAQEKEQKDPRNEREFQDEILKTLRVLVNRNVKPIEGMRYAPEYVHKEYPKGYRQNAIVDAHFNIAKTHEDAARLFLETSDCEILDHAIVGDRIRIDVRGELHRVEALMRAVDTLKG